MNYEKICEDFGKKPTESLEAVIRMHIYMYVLSQSLTSIAEAIIERLEYKMNTLPNNLSNLELLELHTGKLKKYNEFNTKYAKYSDKDMSIFPFKERLLYILGDRYLLPSSSVKIKRSLYNVAESGKWTFKTSEDKILYDFRKYDYELFYLWNSLPMFFY